MPDADQLVTDALNQPEPGTPEFEKALAAEFESDGVVAPPEEIPDAGDATEEAEGELGLDDAPPPPPEPEVVEAPTEIELGGIRVPADKAEALAEFWVWSQTPAGQSYLQTMDAMQRAGIDPSQLQQQAQPQAPQEPAYDEDEFLDPATKRLHADMQAMRAELDQTRQALQYQQASQTQAIIATASKRFSDEHSLSPEDTQKLVDRVDRSVNLQGYATDPNTGSPRDGVSILVAAMEDALWADPTFRQQELDRVKAEHGDRQKKDRKLAAVGGTSGSVPQKPHPTTAEERDEWAVQQISEAMGLAK